MLKELMENENIDVSELNIDDTKLAQIAYDTWGAGEREDMAKFIQAVDRYLMEVHKAGYPNNR